MFSGVSLCLSFVVAIHTIANFLSSRFSGSLDLCPYIVHVALEDVYAWQSSLEHFDRAADASIATLVRLALAQHFLLDNLPDEPSTFQTVTCTWLLSRRTFMLSFDIVVVVFIISRTLACAAHLGQLFLRSHSADAYPSTNDAPCSFPLHSPAFARPSCVVVLCLANAQ
jgi:hypothetical protein